MTAPASSPPKAKFSLGVVVATPGAIAALSRSNESHLLYVQRHQRGDWGDVPAEDAALNDAAVAQEEDPDRRERVLSAYVTRCGERVWVITERDRSSSTLLLPSEY